MSSKKRKIQADDPLGLNNLNENKNKQNSNKQEKIPQNLTDPLGLEETSKKSNLLVITQNRQPYPLLHKIDNLDE